MGCYFSILGINDLVTPVFLVFLRDSPERLESKFDGNSDIIPTDGIKVENLPQLVFHQLL